jgi:phosphate-selective porin OprO/OprP
MKRGTMVGTLLLVMLSFCQLRAQGQQPASNSGPASASQSTPPTPLPETLDDTLEAGDDELSVPVRKLVKWNEFEGASATARVGAGFLYEYAAYSQDEASKEQFALFPKAQIRDARFIFKGSFGADRRVTWSAGIMYDAAATKDFLVRETGVMVAVPRLSGHIFVGRTKEGFSLNKIMVGYAGWTMERATINDATIPILADGIKWLGYAPKKHLLWNLGVFMDALSENQTFSTYDHQIIGRIVWLPEENEETVLHIGLDLRYGKPDDGQLRLRSRPEAFEAPYFIDTGSFPAKHTTTANFETYYRPGPLLFGTEYFVQKVDAPDKGNPVFQGVDSVVSWLATGETRVYNTRGGFFNQVSPARPVFTGGPGAWEIVGRFSYSDLTSGPVQGGKFWRFTPMVNWHLSDNVRLEMTYGYGSLNRFGLIGKTQFFQTRIQLQL